MKMLWMTIGLTLAGCNQDTQHIMIEGDSVSLGYTPYIQSMDSLVVHNGNCSLHTTIDASGDNGGNSQRAAACFEHWMDQGYFKIVHFNAGLHDIHRPHCFPGGATTHEVELSDYLINLQHIIDVIRAKHAIPIFATTTPVDGNIDCHSNSDIIEYNAAAVNLMKDQGIEVDDLYSAMEPVDAQYRLPFNIHFTSDGYELLATQVLTALQAQDSQNNQN